MPNLRSAGIAVAISAAALCILRPVAWSAPETPLVAHEWGTFTALQDDDGTALGAINSDDEPVPSFVCGTGGVRTASSHNELTPHLNSKGIATCHPGVTMRLETPVIYFYPPAQPLAAPVNVRVTFHGGWLTEFYPRAQVDAPDLLSDKTAYPPLLTENTVGSLAWNGVEFAATGKLVTTDDPVWTAPREVPKAAVVNIAGSNTPPEKFLFYRGVGHLHAPLRVVRDAATDLLSLFADSATPNQPRAAAAPDLRIPAAWLVEIRRKDGWCAFRRVPNTLNLGAPATQTLASLPASFAPPDFSTGRLDELRSTMHEALVTAGLFPDEAAAMLKTWELSYFKSPGRRLFYVTPRAWTDQVLPLSIDGAEITRAMIGRIELITPTQRLLLAQIAAGPCPDMEAFTREYYRGRDEAVKVWQERVAKGDATNSSWTLPTMKELKITVPTVYQDYLNLGRFRDALVLHEQQVRPTPALTAFVNGNELRLR